MESSVTQQLGSYWILYFQPLPEAGERIAIAIALQDKYGIRLEYDRKFSKVHKLYPGVSTEALFFFLESLREELSSLQANQDPSLVLASYGPQVMPSAVRVVALPITDQVIFMLLRKYVLPMKPGQQTVEPQEIILDPVAKEIEAFVFNRVGKLKFQSSATPKEILGHPIAGVKPIAMAIPNPQGWTLVDGVDLNRLTIAAAIKRANDIGRTFWNYTRVSSEGARIQTVGIVLNGNSHRAPASGEAHDYILHRFESDADAAIDAHSSDSSAQLQRLLTETSSH
jgi:hypothetical protein